MVTEYIESIHDYKFKNGEQVAYELGNLKGEGKIVGVAAKQLPIMGATYMIEDAQYPNETYPYSVIPMQESAIRKLK